MSSRLSAKAGVAIRKLRLAGGWTLAQLSERSGVPLSTLSKVELGQTSLPVPADSARPAGCG
jgi:transcriptional regulator with XRE-family HTH domain